MTETINNPTHLGQLTSIIGTIPFGLLTLSETHHVAIINRHAVKLLGFNDSTNPNDLIDLPYQEVFQYITELEDHYYRLIVSKRKRRFSLHNTQVNHADYNIVCRTMLQGALITLEDITDSKQLLYRATYDNLTQLFNRQHFEDSASEIFNHIKKHKTSGLLVFFDLDRFKPVNDIAGHAAGDELLKKVATILKSRIRESDIVGRLGGDEFAILFNNCPRDIGQHIVEGIRKDIELLDFKFNGKTFNLSISAGIIEVSDEFDSINELINAADTACLLAKKEGRNRVNFINKKEPRFQAHKQQTLWLHEINQGLELNSFILYAQKIFPLDNDNLSTHYEVLIRLENEQGIHSPTDFLPVAERYDLMNQIDRWVIHKAFSSITINGVFSINLSAQSLSDHSFITYIEFLQNKYAIDPKKIIFEITETSALRSIEQTVEFINHLKK